MASRAALFGAMTAVGAAESHLTSHCLLAGQWPEPGFEVAQPVKTEAATMMAPRVRWLFSLIIWAMMGDILISTMSRFLCGSSD
jgi:hypothetical protein